MDVDSRPNVIPWPPLLLMIAIVSAHVMGGIAPFAIQENSMSRTIGAMTIVAGILLDVWAIITMRRSKTNILPHRAAGRLVTSGPFRFSRNPIYLGNAALCVGLALMTGNVWFIVTATFMVAARSAGRAARGKAS